jgi:hypothetical protein
MANTILTSYPDGKRGASPEYVAELMKALASCSREEMDWIMDRRDGLVARSPKFLPGIGEIAELIRERCKKLDAVRPSATSYSRLTEERIEQPPGERRKAQVRELLGYDPAAPQKRTRREDLVPPSTEDIEGLKGLLKLQRPTTSDASPQLRELLNKEPEQWQ